MDKVSIAGIDVMLPVGPYLTVSALLAVITTAVFLAFALTEDRYSTALDDALVHEPARYWVLLGSAYQEIRTRWGAPG